MAADKTSDVAVLAPRPGFWARSRNRWAALRAGGTRISGFTSQPQPKAKGQAARGRQLLAGNFLFAGALVEARGQSPWDIDAPNADFTAELHGFGWLDDLVAVGSAEARHAAQAWIADWIRRYGTGQGPGWLPELAGRRQIRWITHAIFLMNGLDRDTGRAFMATMGRQAGFLARRWPAAGPGLPRFEALTGFVHSASALSGLELQLPRALRALAQECRSRIDGSGGIETRNPEALLEVFALLTWTSEILADTGRPADPAINTAISRIAPTLRSLRHADGGLARFQGGGRGRPGLLDLALRQSGLRPTFTQGPAMGFARLSGSAASVIVDAAPPLSGRGAVEAHASTLAFELTSGKAPVIVSSGPGKHLGADWVRAGRATPSHSTLVLSGYSSARLGRAADPSLTDAPRRVDCQPHRSAGAVSVALSHDGWSRTHGLTHLRHLTLERDGRLLTGEDGLAAMDAGDRDRLDALLPHMPDRALDYSLHFHLHPEVEPVLDMGGQAVSLMLKTGEVWVFRQVHDGGGDPATLAIKPSVYLDSRHLKPRATKQIVLTSRLTGYGSAVRWSLARPVEPPRRKKNRAPLLL